MMEQKTFTFPEMEYVRPDFEEIGEKAKELTARVDLAKSYEEVKSCLLEMEEFSKHMRTAVTIVSIRHTLNGEFMNASFSARSAGITSGIFPFRYASSFS